MGHSAGILIGSSRDHPGVTTGYSLGIHGIPFGPRANLTLMQIMLVLFIFDFPNYLESLALVSPVLEMVFLHICTPQDV